MSQPRTLPNNVKWDVEEALRLAHRQQGELLRVIAENKRGMDLELLQELPELVSRGHEVERLLELVLYGRKTEIENRLVK